MTDENLHPLHRTFIIAVTLTTTAELVYFTI